MGVTAISAKVRGIPSLRSSAGKEGAVAASHRLLAREAGHLTLTLKINPVLAKADQPNMPNALDQLQVAKAFLKAASENKSRQRVNAIRLIDPAIIEVEMGINVAPSAVGDTRMGPSPKQLWFRHLLQFVPH